MFELVIFLNAIGACGTEVSMPSVRLFFFSLVCLFLSIAAPCTASREKRLVQERGRLKWSLQLLDSIEGIDVSSELRREINFGLQNNTLPPGALFDQLLMASGATRLTTEQAKIFLQTIEAGFTKTTAEGFETDLLCILRTAHYEIQYQRIRRSGIYLEDLGLFKNTGLLRWRVSDIYEDFYRVRACLEAPGISHPHNMDQQTLKAIENFLLAVSNDGILEQKLVSSSLLMLRMLLEALEGTPQFMDQYDFLYRQFLELLEFFHDEIRYQYQVKRDARVEGLRQAQRRDNVLVQRVDFVINPDGTISIPVQGQTVEEYIATGLQKAWRHFMPASLHGEKSAEGGKKDSWLRRVRRR